MGVTNRYAIASLHYGRINLEQGFGRQIETVQASEDLKS